MRMLLDVRVPHEPFNSLVRSGQAGELMGRILQETKPEAVYFTERDGHRGATMIIDVQKASDVPSYAEPWFLKFNADCTFRIVMSPDDLAAAGLDELGKKWG